MLRAQGTEEIVQLTPACGEPQHDVGAKKHTGKLTIISPGNSSKRLGKKLGTSL